MTFFFLWAVSSIHVFYSFVIIRDIAISNSRWCVRAVLIVSLAAWASFMWIIGVLSLSEAMKGFL